MAQTGFMEIIRSQFILPRQKWVLVDTLRVLRIANARRMQDVKPVETFETKDKIMIGWR